MLSTRVKKVNQFIRMENEISGSKTDYQQNSPDDIIQG